MSLDADLIVDRRRMRRKLTFWRVLAIVVIVLAIAWIGRRREQAALGFADTGAYIARVTIRRTDPRRSTSGCSSSIGSRAVVDGARRRRSCRQSWRHHRRLRATLRRADAAQGKEAARRRGRGLAASGGYITALAGDHIVAKQTSLVGSIGVLFQYPERRRSARPGSASRSRPSNRPRSRRRRTASSRPRRRRARRSSRSSRIPTPGSAAWCGPPPSRRRGARAASPTAACSPGTRASTCKLVDEIGDERDRRRLAGDGEERRRQAAGAGLQLHSRFGDLPFLHAAAAALLDASGPRPRWPAACDELGRHAGDRAAQS